MSNAPDAFVYNATLDRIVDGDTLDCILDLGFDVKLHKQRVRLAGIDTPESRINTKRYPDRAEEKVLGLKAKERLKELEFYEKPTARRKRMKAAAVKRQQKITRAETAHLRRKPKHLI